MFPIWIRNCSEDVASFFILFLYSSGKSGNLRCRKCSEFKAWNWELIFLFVVCIAEILIKWCCHLFSKVRIVYYIIHDVYCCLTLLCCD
jgi:hypothetical protein